MAGPLIKRNGEETLRVKITIHGMSPFTAEVTSSSPWTNISLWQEGTAVLRIKVRGNTNANIFTYQAQLGIQLGQKSLVEEVV